MNIESFNSLQTGKAFRTYFGCAEQSCPLWFQFPSNGKGFPNEELVERVEREELGFNSLQTGKAFRTKIIMTFSPSSQEKPVSIPFKRERLSELWILGRSKMEKETVSIPFKRERLSELFLLRLRWWSLPLSFNSLQTGKAFRTRSQKIHGRGCNGFNSLQTGKAFRTLCW